MKEIIYCPKHLYVFIPLETYLESFNEALRAGYMYQFDIDFLTGF